MNDTAPDAAPDCAPAQRIVRTPRERLPAGTCDCHLHVFGDRARYPLDALRDAAGEGDAYRGVAVPDAAASDEELLAMDALGVRGIRLNVVNPQVLAVDDAIALGKRMHSRGWHLQVHLKLAGDGATTLARLVDRVDVPIVVDHFGRPEPGSTLPRLLLDLVASGRVWVKLSAAYRIARPEHARTDIEPFVDALVAANPARLDWGSDWPHTELQATPHDADLVDLLVATLPDATTLHRVCVDNPASLYGF